MPQVPHYEESRGKWDDLGRARDTRTAAQRNRKLFLQWLRSLIRPTWAPLFVLMIHLIALSFQLYKAYPHVDIPMHFFGGVSMAYFLNKAFVAASLITAGAPPTRLLESVLIVTATCTVAVFWEFFEFVLSWALATDLQGSLANTTKDLFFGMAGGLFFTATVNLPIYTASRFLKWVGDHDCQTGLDQHRFCSVATLRKHDLPPRRRP
jgi:hypothetical protein